MTPEHARAVLTYFATIEPVERRIRRRERFAIPICSVAAIVFAIVPAVTFGTDFLDYAALALAVGYALAVRSWLLCAIERRRYWRRIGETVAEARRTLGA